MVTKFCDINPSKIEKARGGEGFVECFAYNALYNKSGCIKAFNLMELEAGSSVGVHSHIHDFEIYIIVEGSGLYFDNGKEVEVSKGDMMLCDKGENHGLKAVNEKIRFIAAIIE